MYLNIISMLATYRNGYIQCLGYIQLSDSNGRESIIFFNSIGKQHFLITPHGKWEEYVLSFYDDATQNLYQHLQAVLPRISYESKIASFKVIFKSVN